MKLETLSDEAKLKVAAHVKDWHGCKRCTIGRFCRNYVFFRGVVPCDILFIGEAPGTTEDLLGEPFVGLAGGLLDHWIESAVANCLRSCGWSPIWSITNTVLCRPTDYSGGPNRMPSAQEMENCSPRLGQFIYEIAQPKGIITLGKVSAVFLEEFFGFKDLLKKFPYCNLLHPASVNYKWNRKAKSSPDNEREVKKLSEFLCKLDWIQKAESQMPLEKAYSPYSGELKRLSGTSGSTV